MLINKLKLNKQEEGNALVLFFLFFFIFVGATGVVFDMGLLYKTKGDLRKTANAAVLSGAQELMRNDSGVSQVVNTILKAEGEEDSLKELLVRPNNENKVTVTLEKNISMTFMKLFKINNVPVKVSSSAGVAPLSSAKGAVPLGIEKNTQLEYLKEYKLKVDAGGSSSGNFGVLALSGTGANLYEQDLMYGFQNELKVGDVVDTQTGNIEGKTRNGVNFRINSSSYTLDDYKHKDDPRVILILVYEPHQISSNQLKSVRICGFAYFYLRKPMSNQDSEIVGYFIQRVGTGTGSVNLRDTGAYAIRLVD